jgi:ABC-2 type transport system ATP-binding protein
MGSREILLVWMHCIAPGQRSYVVFTGPNGAGKTNTLSAIEGLLKPQSGNITVAGFSIKDKPFMYVPNLGVNCRL